MLTTAISWLILFGSLIVVVRQVKRSRRGKLPPGPPADLILGHLRIFPQTNQGQQFYEWSKQYGDVIHLDLLGKSIIVLNSQQAAADLLDKRSAKYSDRPEFPAFKLLGWDDLLVFLRYGPDFQKQRRFFQQTLTRQECLMYRSIQLEQAHTLLKNLLRSPDDFYAHIRRFASAITVEMIYGRKIVDDDDEFTRVAEEGDAVASTMSKVAILDLFPSLIHLPAWFPGAWFIRYARDKRYVKQAMEDTPFEQTRKQMGLGEIEPCFVSKHLEDFEREGKTSPDDLNLLKVAAGHMWTAGSDTTWATLLIIFLSLVRNPEATKKAQAEIDRVIGQGRLPTFDDADDLPYVQCVIYEAMRWRSAVPLGIPHRAMEDDVYRDMFIPKDSTIIVNTTGIAMDGAVYKDAHQFWPDRYLPENGAEPAPTGEVFGFGRRICPGRYLAEASLWVATASLLAAFNIECLKDEKGQDVFPEAIFNDGIASHPEPFQCRIQPRSKQAENLIAEL